MGDHAGPSGNQAVAQHLGTNKGTYDPDTPHTDDIDDKGCFCFAHALHHAFNDDGETVKEKSINIELMFIEETTVRMLAKYLLKQFNQESIILTIQNTNSELIENLK